VSEKMNLLLLLPRWVRKDLNTPVIELGLPQTQTKENLVREMEVQVLEIVQTITILFPLFYLLTF
jgi:hypothetical protein